MTAALAPFAFEGQTVRIVTDGQGEPWFVAVDVARVLGYSESAAMTRTLDEDEKGLRTLQTLGGEQQLVTVSESGLFSAILRSRVPAAQAFKRWLTREVLPALRRTGSYAAPVQLPTTRELAAMVIAEADRADVAEALVAELEPAAAVTRALVEATGDYSLREAAQVLSRDHGIETGQNRLLGHLRKLGWVDTRGRPYQSQIQTGRIAVLTRTYDDPHTGEPMLSTQTRVTAKGLTWLHQHWNDGPPALRSLPGGVS